jgi:integrase
MPRKRQKRLYTKRGRYYADFRDYADVGGGKEALIPSGERFATDDEQQAKQLLEARLEELEGLRLNGPFDPAVDLTRLGDFVDYYMVYRAGKPDASVRRLKQLAQQLEYAVGYFGADVKLRDIDTIRLEEYLDHLAGKVKGNRGPDGNSEAETISRPTQRKYLYALSRLFRRARARKLVPPTHDPIANLDEKPSGRRATEADWLEHDEAALLLYAASLYKPKRSDSIRYADVLIGTLLLTGARLEEVLGLTLADVNLDRRTIRIRSARGSTVR